MKQLHDSKGCVITLSIKVHFFPSLQSILTMCKFTFIHVCPTV